MTQIKEYILKNSLVEVSLLNIGATLHKLIYKGQNRILSYDNLEDYKTNLICLGSMAGQVAGRISNHKFRLNGKEYVLDNNESDYCIHGGFTNLTNTYWDVLENKPNATNPYIIFKTVLADGVSGFPGNVEFRVKYILISSTLRLEIFAKSDKDTIVNVTNHAYFNFNSDKSKSITNHNLKINANKIIELDSNCIPKAYMDVEGTDFDLRQEKSLEILNNQTHEQMTSFKGYDHPFILNGNIPALRFSNEEVAMTITTSYPAMVVYSGNFIGESFNIGNTKSYDNQGICFEAQYETDFINQDFLPTHVLKGGEEKMEIIEFTFD